MKGYELICDQGEARVLLDDDIVVVLRPRNCCLMHGWIAICPSESDPRSLAKFRNLVVPYPKSKIPKGTKGHYMIFTNGLTPTSDLGLMVISGLLLRGMERSAVRDMVNSFTIEEAQEKVRDLIDWASAEGMVEELRYRTTLAFSN